VKVGSSPAVDVPYLALEPLASTAVVAIVTMR
jgi:hypothetical protein